MALAMPSYSCATKIPMNSQPGIAANAPSSRDFRRQARCTSSLVILPMITGRSCRTFRTTGTVVDGQWQSRSVYNASGSDAAFSGREENNSGPLQAAEAERVDRKAGIVDGLDDNKPPQGGHGEDEMRPTHWWSLWKKNGNELRARVAKFGLSAVLAYGLFDGVTYTSFFVAAFLGYEKSTGQNPAANLKALLGIVILMWTGNNVTRPFRVAGAAALAPAIDRGLKKVQQGLKLPNLAFAFMLVVALFASSCFGVVGLLILSRVGK